MQKRLGQNKVSRPLHTPITTSCRALRSVFFGQETSNACQREDLRPSRGERKGVRKVSPSKGKRLYKKLGRPFSSAEGNQREGNLGPPFRTPLFWVLAPPLKEARCPFQEAGASPAARTRASKRPAKDRILELEAAEASKGISRARASSR